MSNADSDPPQDTTRPPIPVPKGSRARIGSYRILERLGEGGMGEVFLAEQEHPLRRRVALKIIKLGMDTKEVIGRFESERQALAIMNHPNIAKVFDAGVTALGRPYFVMEHVPGVPITEYCDRHRLNTRERLELFIPVCHAIHHAHQKGVIHRDIKPSNVLVAIQDGKPVPKVIDFGVAKAIEKRLTERTVFTEQGRVIGTPAYMSPEQAEMTGLNIDTTTDVYSLGVLLYELLVGALPFNPDDLLDVGLEAMHRIIREVDPPAPSSRISTLGDAATDVASHRRTDPGVLVRQIQGELDWITMRAMEKDRVRRYPSASEFAADIERHLHHEPVVAGPPGTVYRIRKFAKRHQGAVAAVAAVILALLIGLGVSTTMFFRAEAAREEAKGEAAKATQINLFLQDMLRSVDPAEKGHDVTVREVLDEAAELVKTDLAGQPEVQAAAQSTIGNTYVALGLYSHAEPHLQTSLSTRQDILGPSDLDVASSLSDLGALRLNQGKYEEADSLFRSALSMNRSLLGDEHPTLAMDMNNLALTLKSQGKYAEAESLFRESLSLRRTAFGDASTEVAKSLNNLAALLQAQGRSAEAELLMREVLTIRRALLRPDHPEIASSLNTMGALLQAQNKYAEAERAFREALDLSKEIYPDKHASMAIIALNLGAVLKYQGKYDEAEHFYREAIALFRSTVGEKHTYVAFGLNSLAILLQEMDRLPEAESLHRQALAMRIELLGSRHDFVATSHTNLALVLHDLGKLAEAESHYRDALEIRQDQDHPKLASTLMGLGSLLIDMNDAAGAEPLLRRSLQIRLDHYREDSWQVAYSENALGHCLTELGEYEEAESLLVRSIPILKTCDSLSRKRRQRAVEHIIALYEAWGKPDRATAYGAELQSLSE